MGFNTTIFILNDQLDSIRTDPARFVDDLQRAIRSRDGRYVLGQTTVMPTAHADEFRLYATRCNDIIELSTHAAETMRLVHGKRWQREIVASRIRQAEAQLAELRAEIVAAANTEGATDAGSATARSHGTRSSTTCGCSLMACSSATGPCSGP